jgi:hypothetical protein
MVGMLAARMELHWRCTLSDISWGHEVGLGEQEWGS